MSYTVAKNLRVNKKTGVISGDFAESNVFDCVGKRCYSHYEDIYNNKEKTRSPIEKYSRFIYDILSGNLQGSLGKYNKLSFSNYYQDRDYFEMKYPEEDSFVMTYKKYEKEIEKRLKSSEKDYIVEFNSGLYLSKLNTKTYRTSSYKEKATHFSYEEIPKIKRCFETENPTIINMKTGEKIAVKDFEYKSIPAEIESAYKLIIPSEMEFKEACDKMYNIAKVVDEFSNNDLDEETIIDFYDKQVKEVLGVSDDGRLKSLFSFRENINNDFRFVLGVYPELKKLSYSRQENENPAFFVSYRVECLDLITLKSKEYSGDSMSINIFLHDENSSKLYLLSFESNFKKELIKELNNQKQEENEEQYA